MKDDRAHTHTLTRTHCSNDKQLEMKEITNPLKALTVHEKVKKRQRWQSSTKNIKTVGCAKCSQELNQ
jgi:hypothetical protein